MAAIKYSSWVSRVPQTGHRRGRSDAFIFKALATFSRGGSGFEGIAFPLGMLMTFKKNITATASAAMVTNVIIYYSNRPGELWL